jgi:DNA-binding ferritin-like protein (Dps family)
MGEVQERLEDAHNLAVLGATQTGKTSFARELHDRTPRVSIWVNERGDHRVPNVAGVEARTLQGVKEAFANDEWRVNYLPADRREAIVELQEWLWTVADRVDRQLPMQVVVDEVDRVAEQSGKSYGNLPARDAVRDFTSEGVKRGVKFVGITQDPVTYDKQALRQSRYRAVWDMSAENRNAVRKYDFDWGAVESAPRYAGVLHHMSGRVIGQVKAEARYA